MMDLMRMGNTKYTNQYAYYSHVMAHFGIQCQHTSQLYHIIYATINFSLLSVLFTQCVCAICCGLEYDIVSFWCTFISQFVYLLLTRLHLIKALALSLSHTHRDLWHKQTSKLIYKVEFDIYSYLPYFQHRPPYAEAIFRAFYWMKTSAYINYSQQWVATLERIRNISLNIKVCVCAVVQTNVWANLDRANDCICATAVVVVVETICEMNGTHAQCTQNAENSPINTLANLYIVCKSWAKKEIFFIGY